MGLYSLSWIAAYYIGLTPGWSQTEAAAGAVLDQLRAWQTGTQTFQPYGPMLIKKGLLPVVLDWLDAAGS